MTGESPISTISQSAPTHPIKRSKLSDVLVAELKRDIVNGRYLPENRLPREAELVSEYGVGRASIRQALRTLEAEGMISMIPGSKYGAQINQPGVRQLTASMGYLLHSTEAKLGDLFKLRRKLEPPFVAEIAAAPDPQLAGRLIEALSISEQGKQRQDMEIYTEGLRVFHTRLREASPNQVEGLFLEMVAFATFHQQVQIDRDMPNDSQVHRELLESGISAREVLAGMIGEGDGEAAAAHWASFLESAIAKLQARGQTERRFTAC